MKFKAHWLPCIVQLCVFQVVFHQKHDSLKFGFIVGLRCANNDCSVMMFAYKSVFVDSAVSASAILVLLGAAGTRFLRVARFLMVFV